MSKRGLALSLSMMMIFSLVIVVIDIAPTAKADIIYVNDDGTPGVDCNYTSIQDAIAAATEE